MFSVVSVILSTQGMSHYALNLTVQGPHPLGYGTSLYRPPKPWSNPSDMESHCARTPIPPDMGPHCTETPRSTPARDIWWQD